MSTFYVQSTIPTIKLYHKDNISNCYHIFSGRKGDFVSGTNLQSYSFQKSIKSFSGSFSLTVKEDVVNQGSLFMDKLQPLDIVEIYEDGTSNKIDFIGVVTNFTYSTDASGYNKTISIQGKSVSALLEMLNLNTEITAMVVTDSALNTQIEDLNIKLASAKENQTIKNIVQQVFSIFCNVVEKNQSLSNSGLISVINQTFGNDFFVFERQLKVYIAVVSNFFQRDVVTFPEYIENLLDQSIYEIYEDIVGNKPKIKIRECPFDKLDWQNLPFYTVDPAILLNYTINRSIDSVYTAFYSFIEGSEMDSEFYVKAGNSKALVDIPEKRKLYGYKPLRANFVGYSPKYSFDKDKKDNMQETFKKLNTRLANWYGKLDEMYLGTITVARVKNMKYAKIGERLRFIGGEFYITGEDHQWRYGITPKIIYHVERGGRYDSTGTFNELKGFTKRFSELVKDNK